LVVLQTGKGYYLYNLSRIQTSPKSTSVFGPEQSLL
jgi:hypothetical protein